MMHYTDDPVRDAERYQIDLERENSREVLYCDECGDEIHDDFCFNIHGRRLCSKCVDYLYKEWR